MATQATGFSNSDAIRGIDVSHYQGNIDWAQVAGAGIKFCYVKATEGSGLQDIRFHDYSNGSKAAGLVTGAYHFFRPEVDAEAQAESFLHVVSALNPGDLPPTLDVEVDAGQSARAIVSGMQTWLEAVENVLGQRPLIYTNPAFWNSKVGGSAAFTDYVLWIAQYTLKPAPQVPTGFGDYLIWQFTEQGRVPGIAGNVDLDRFNGTPDELNALAGF